MVRQSAACALALLAFAAIPRANAISMAQIAREYVRLVLAMGRHDPDYVDAYYGPADVKAEADARALTLDEIGKSVNTVTESIKSAPVDGRDELSRLRRQ